MERCKEAFEKWHGFGVALGMDIQTEIAWKNWQAAWNAARDSLTDKAQKAACDQNCTIWLTDGTHVREKFAYEDGHHRGWRDAKSHIAHN